MTGMPMYDPSTLEIVAGIVFAILTGAWLAEFIDMV